MTLLARLRAHARQQPAACALHWPGGAMDFAALAAQIEATMTWLRDTAVEVLAVSLENGPAWVVLDIAAMELGICLVPLPAFFSAGQLRHAVRMSGATALLTDQPTLIREQLADLLGADVPHLLFEKQTLSWMTVISHRQRRGVPLPAGTTKVTFTSGTTGAPKGVVLGWDHMRPVVESLVEAVEIGANDRHLVLMPLPVLLENIAGVYAPLWAGATVMLRPLQQVGLCGSSALDGRTMAMALADAAASTAIFTPQTLQGVVEALEHDSGICPALRFAAVGGAPVSPRLLQRAGALGLPVFEGYGLSECASVVCLNTPTHHRAGSVGRPLPHVRLGLAADGEVVVQGAAFGGYLGESEAPPASWPTGDIGEIDPAGFLHLKGRRRNVFITAFGRNVAPEWVERELTLEPAIAQAAVFGEARPYNVAVIVPDGGATPADIESALARTNRALPDYARVVRWVFADAPFSPHNGLLTGTGRIRRDAVYARHEKAVESLYREARTS